MQQVEMRDWLKGRKHLWWWVSDVEQLDDEAILEGVMNYGRWRDFLFLKNNMSLRKIDRLFKYMTQEKKRVNLRPEKIALFGNYLKRYVKN